MSTEPRKETSQRGMDCKKPTSSMAVTISLGRVAVSLTAPPTPPITVCTIPPQMEKMAVMSSIPEPTATLAAAKRRKCRRAYSGRWISRKDAADWNTPMAKNSTSRP